VQCSSLCDVKDEQSCKVVANLNVVVGQYFSLVGVTCKLAN